MEQQTHPVTKGGGGDPERRALGPPAQGGPRSDMLAFTPAIFHSQFWMCFRTTSWLN